MSKALTWTLRSEHPRHADGIDRVHRRAFQGENAGGLVRRLRAEGGYDPALSLVAEEEGGAGEVLGHVLFSPIAIVRGDAPAPALALGPLGVLPARQGQGLGSALVRAGLEACRKAGYGIVLVLGDPGYYSRFGFLPASGARIEPPRPEWAGAFQVLALIPGALDVVRGIARYPEAFDDV